MTEFARRLLTVLAVLGSAVSSISAFADERDDPGQWTQVFLSGPIQHRLSDGTTRVLHPMCSGGPIVTPQGLAPAPMQYSFFIKRGDPKKLVVALDGGGACWNANTCVGSPLSGQGSSYSEVVDETPQTLAQGEGLLDDRNPHNPYKHYTKVFIPYCTGDVFWGNKDTVYVLPLPTGGGLPWIIHHHGADNLLAVLHWLQTQNHEAADLDHQVADLDLRKLKDLSVIGTSAGGYGTMLAFPYFAQETPHARLNLIGDASIGVLTGSFYREALFNPANPGAESWGFGQNLPSWVPGYSNLLVSGLSDARLIMPTAFAALASYKPRAHFASLTNNFDNVQIGFYGLMKGVFPPGLPEVIEWYGSMKFITLSTAALPNYRFFIDRSAAHTLTTSNAQTYGVGVNGISLAAWIKAMVKPGSGPWDNLDNAGPPGP
ncbi:MAG: hypothetical protein HYX63_11505 [Gammaproteobacteria bacterium]|nr:hypothetical protein [Gammaproteobacteria bacterium]